MDNNTNASTPEWGVIFDMDGTMVDNLAYHEQAWLEFGRRHQLPITPDFYRAQLHSRSNDVIAHALLGPGVSPAQAQSLSEEKESIYRELYLPHVRENPGLSRLLDELMECGIPRAAASNSPRVNVELILKALGVRERFNAVVALTDVERGKPYPDLVLAAASELGLPASRCLVMEDSVSGFRAAEAAGAPYIVITIGADRADLKYATQARAVHHDFTDLNRERLRGYLDAAPA